jgi:hypothetical protein
MGTFMIPWHIDPLLGKDLERNKTAIVMQRHSKHASTIVTIGNSIFYSVRAKGL